MKKLFYLLLALPLLFAACETNSDEPQNGSKKASLELTSDQTMEFDAKGGEGTIAFSYTPATTNNSTLNPTTGTLLSVACDADWISVDSEVDVTLSNITFEVATNDTQSAREATIKASIKELSFEVRVKQAAAESGGNNDDPGNDPKDEFVEGWAINGTMNGWEKSEATAMSEEGNYFVVKGLELTAEDNFNFIFDGGAKSYGGNGQAAEPNYIYEAMSWGSNISVAEAGTYDIYLSTNLAHYYIMTEGNDPANAEEVLKPGEERWSLYGSFKDYESVDIALTENGKYLSATGLEFVGNNEFVVRCNGGEKYTLGLNSDATYAPESEIKIVDGGSAIKVDVEAGEKYDIYFIANTSGGTSQLWVMPEGQYPIIWNRVDGAYMPTYNNFILYLITNDIVLSLDFKAGNETVVNYVIPAGTYYVGDTEGTGWCFDIGYCLAKIRGREVPILDGSMTIEHKNGKYDIWVDMRTATLDILKMHYVGEIGFDPFFSNMGGQKLNNPAN